MRIGRTLPPAAAPIYPQDILAGLKGIFQGDKAVKNLEEEFREYFQVRHCFLVSSGKAALTLILKVLKKRFPEKDEVLIPAFTCYSVPSAIVRAGLKVTLCDVDPNTLDFNFSQLNTKLSNNKLLCIIPTHLFGIPADVDRVKKLTGNLSIPIVEDAAQALGNQINGRKPGTKFRHSGEGRSPGSQIYNRKLGTLGDIGFLSLGRGKAFSTVEGGIILTNSDEIAGHLSKMIRNLDRYNYKEIVTLISYALALMIFMHPLLFWFPKSLPFLKLGETIYDPTFKIKKMTGFQAGLASGWEKKLKKFQKERRSVTEKWLNLLAGTFLSFRAVCNKTSWPIRLPVRIGTEEKTRQILQQNEKMGLGLSITYPDSINGIEPLARYFKGQNFPAARKAARQTITLPVHGFVKTQDQKKILKIITGA